MNPYQDKKILITGGLGFIGSNLAISLVECGAEVTLIDSLIPEYGGNLHNVSAIQSDAKINISDVRDPHSLAHLVTNQDVLFNLAGQTSHLDSMTDPHTDLEINCRAQLSILETCRKNNPNLRIVFASTRQLYGKPQYVPVDERHPVHPIDVNGINKLAGENYHELYCKVHGIPTCILRFTNTIGPRMRIKDSRQTFLGIWIRNLLENKPIEVWGGDQLRDILYIDDAVDALLRAGSDAKAVGEIFNVGRPDSISLIELANTLVRANGHGKIVVNEYPAERKKIDIGDYYTDASLIQQTLGWTAKVPLESALSETLAFYRKNLSHYV